LSAQIFDIRFRRHVTVARSRPAFLGLFFLYRTLLKRACILLITL